MGYSIRKFASEKGISVPTSFNWRHKIPRSLNDISDNDFRFVCESDGIFFLNCEKGNRNLTRKPRFFDSKVSATGITRDHVQPPNSNTSRLKIRIRDFNGVSTRYLQNDLSWFITLEKPGKKSLPLKTFGLIATSKSIFMCDLKNVLINHSCI
jgi:hypothetical protein